MKRKGGFRRLFSLQRVRSSVQALFLLTFLWLLVRTAYPLALPVSAEVWLRFDPLIALTTWIAGRSLVAALLPSLVVVGMTLILGQIFCGWICPLGASIDWSDRFLLARRWNAKGEHQNGMRRVKFYLLTGLVVLALATVDATISLAK